MFLHDCAASKWITTFSSWKGWQTAPEERAVRAPWTHVRVCVGVGGTKRAKPRK